MLRHVAMFRFTARLHRRPSTRPPSSRCERCRRSSPRSATTGSAPDLGLVEGNWQAVVVADFDDEAAWRTYSQDPTHLQIIAEQMRAHRGRAGRRAVRHLTSGSPRRWRCRSSATSQTASRWRRTSRSVASGASQAPSQRGPDSPDRPGQHAHHLALRGGPPPPAAARRPTVAPSPAAISSSAPAASSAARACGSRCSLGVSSSSSPPRPTMCAGARSTSAMGRHRRPSGRCCSSSRCRHSRRVGWGVQSVDASTTAASRAVVDALGQGHVRARSRGRPVGRGAPGWCGPADRPAWPRRAAEPCTSR